MKIIQLLLITLFFTTFLQASYLRSIRVGAFEAEFKAKKELAKLNSFVQKHQNILDLQTKNDFEVKYRKTGKYYVTVVEPLRSRVVLQEVLDTLRLAYTDVYVTKLTESMVTTNIVKKEPIVIAESVVEVVPEEIAVITEEKIKEIPLIEKTVDEVIVVQKKVKKAPEPLEYTFEEKIEVTTKPMLNADSQESQDMYKIPFFIVLLMSIVFILLLLKSKRKNKSCKTRERETNIIFDKKDIEIRHKDSFLSHAKTSVATIHNFTNLLLEFELTVIQKDYVQRIRSSSEHLLNTVNNTLDITKLRNNTLAIENSEFDINEMLKKVAKIISLEAKNKNIAFDLLVENDVPAFIIGDPTRIRQVLINLLGNSVKYTNEGKIGLTVKVLYNYTHAVSIGFLVADTGIGMTEDQVEDIHDSSAEIVEGGTVGLGLSVTKQLIEMMNGEIKIYSTPDVGTTFTFSLKFGLTR